MLAATPTSVRIRCKSACTASNLKANCIRQSGACASGRGVMRARDRLQWTTSLHKILKTLIVSRCQDVGTGGRRWEEQRSRYDKGTKVAHRTPPPRVKKRQNTT